MPQYQTNNSSSGDKLKLAKDYFNKMSTPTPKLVMPSKKQMIDEGKMDLLGYKNENAPTVKKKQDDLMQPVPVFKMPSRKQMVQEGKMDLINKPNPEFGKEMAKEKAKVALRKSYRESY